VRTASDGVVSAHLADPGRLRELLVPGAELRLLPAASGTERATRFTVVLVRSSARPFAWVGVETARANRLAERLLAAGAIAGVPVGSRVRREVAYGRSRFDFLLERPGRRSVLVEVKSVTLVVDGVGRFPDAPTARGARHLRELARAGRRDQRAAVLFVVQRHDARAVAPHPAIDPGFARALAAAARAGVVLRAARFRLDARGRATHVGPVPVEIDTWFPATGAPMRAPSTPRT